MLTGKCGPFEKQNMYMSCSHGQGQCQWIPRHLKSHLSKNAVWIYFTVQEVNPPLLRIVGASPGTQGQLFMRRREDKMGMKKGQEMQMLHVKGPLR